jgi:hypothetical protein
VSRTHFLHMNLGTKPASACSFLRAWSFRKNPSAKMLLLAVIAVAPLFSTEARAQQPAQAAWKGALRNPAGAPIAGAKVSLAGNGNGSEATTGNDGSYVLEALPTGQYSLTVQTKERKIRYGLPIDLTAAAAPVLLTLSDRGELTVTVQQNQAATGGEELSSQAVSELPLNKRDFGTLLLLAAGTMTDTNGSTNFTAQFAINGQRGVEAVFAMDGADISDPEMGGATFSNFNVDAVEQIQSSSGWMPAEIGRGAAGYTNIITRSGASGFHGSMFEFVRNSAFDARNYFDHATLAYPGRIPPFRRNEFGFTNGGPVYLPRLYDGRSRTFYFTEYQGFRQVLGTTQVMPVPDADDRAGIDTLKFPDGLTDTLTVPVDPGIAAVLKRYPMPNNPTGSYHERTYSTASKVVTNADQFSLRIDHRISAKDQFFARFTLDNITGPTTNPAQTAIDPTFGVVFIDRERNVVGKWTRTVSPRLNFEMFLNIQRSTPGFPTPNTTDAGLTLDDNLFEGFNTAAGSVMQAYGNIFQYQSNVQFTTARHAFKMGGEWRANRDTTYWGSGPNGKYQFGGGPAYSSVYIPSQSGLHDVHPGDRLPDTLSSFLSGSPFAYSRAVAPPYFSSGEHIGPAAISRDNVNAYFQDTWKLTNRLTLNYGVRWEIHTPIRERAKRTSGLQMVNGVQRYVVNPQPGYRKQWNGWGPRVQIAWQASKNLRVNAGGGITVIPPNLWRDNYLTGAAPFAVMPRLLSASSAPIHYGFQITPSQLPRAYTASGADMFPNGDTKAVAPNTEFDVDRYEQDIAALTPGKVVSALELSSIDETFVNATLYTWTLGLERSFGNLTGSASYVGTAAQKLPSTSFPNAYPGATPAYAKYTRFDNAGNVIGGYGFENVLSSIAHSSYNAFQASISGNLGRSGPGLRASYTWSKSIDNSSTSSHSPQNPFDTHPERGPSSFDTSHSFGVSVAQDMHLESVGMLRPLGRKFTNGWELLSISSISSGSPFTVFSGIQQTGVGSKGADRPDQIAKPDLSTAREVRQDYFGKGVDNASTFFSVPIHLAGGTGPNQGRFGTLGRNTFRGPAYYNFDLAIIKDTAIGRRKSGAERMALQMRGEFFNLFNIVNMGLPANVLAGSGFGEISKTAGTSRQIQLSLKLVY